MAISPVFALEQLWEKVTPDPDLQAWVEDNGLPIYEDWEGAWEQPSVEAVLTHMTTAGSTSHLQGEQKNSFGALPFGHYIFTITNDVIGKRMIWFWPNWIQRLLWRLLGVTFMEHPKTEGTCK